jgi:hypothetical protein
MSPTELKIVNIYSERQKYGINSLKDKKKLKKKIFGQVDFSL